MFRYAEPISPKTFEETPFTWIDTPNKLSDMLDKLREAQEIAIDLEHHSYRTFSGFVCLMQISTRNNDYVVDTLALREELEELNEVFTNPKIVKVRYHYISSSLRSHVYQVFHGAESDIVWLQQDFNLYIVNLFDTYHASRALGELQPLHLLTHCSTIKCGQLSQGMVLPRCWKCTATLHRTNVISLQIGAYGMSSISSQKAPLTVAAVHFLKRC